MDFVAIDFETANQKRSSICQVGIACFEDGRMVNHFESLVNPGERFAQCCIRVHGITATDVRHSPTLPSLHGDIQSFLSGQIVISHTEFDEVALRQAIAKYRLPHIGCSWLDTCAIAR